MTNRLTIVSAFMRRLAAPLLSAMVMASAITGSQAQLVNTGQVNGTPVAGSIPLPLPTSTVSIPVAAATPAITVVKTVTANDENGDGHGQVGETLTYTFNVTNSGNVTLNNISLSDPSATMSGGPLATLAPGATDSSTFSATYTLAPADISSGSHSNQATATATSAVVGSPPGGVTDLSDSSNPLDGPGPNDPTVISITPAPIVAVDDTGSANGSIGIMVPALNVLTNDTLNGVAVVPADVTITPVTTGPLTVNADGTVNVAPNTPAGPYTITYTVCETLNPANCDTADVVVSVYAPTIVADNDSASGINGLIGAPFVLNAFANDTLNGVAVVPADLTVTIVTAATNPNVTMNLATGSVSVAPDTAAGVYTITYQICETLNPTNCDTAVASVTVVAPAIVAFDDTGSANGLTGGTVTALNVLTNDTLNGVAIVPADVTITPITTGPLTVNADGTVTVAPNTPAGPYTVNYTVCENLNPANCDTADVVITVTAPAIVAVDDAGSANGLTGGVVPSLNVLGNDTLNGVAVVPANVTITPVTTGPLTVNADGTVTVAPNTPAGPYTVSYTVCDAINPANCDTADVVVTVYAASILANDDSAAGINGLTGAASAITAFVNDTLNGLAVVPANITATIVSPSTNPNVTMNLATGVVSVAPGTAAGVYTITYRICENLNPANCDTAIASVTVVAPAIVAADDTGTANGFTGGVVPSLNVLTNDTLNGVAIVPADVVITPVTTGPLTVNANGTVNVAPNTPAGPYTVSYTVCEILNPANCDTADVVITVNAPAIVAVDDTGTASGITGGTVPSLNVLGNDTLNGVAIDPADVTITPVTTGPLTVNADGTVDVAPNTPAGPYTVSYTACEILNPANCDTADVVITVTAPTILTSDDTGSTNDPISTTVPLLNVLDNDTLNGVAIVPAEVTITPVTTGPLTVNADGTVAIVPDTVAGIYTVAYTVCEILNPANCDTADAVITVSPPTLLAADDAGSANGLTGGTVPALNVLDNDTLNGIPVNPAKLTITQVTTGPLTVNPDGTVTVAPNTPAGPYTVTYTVCEVLNPANCDTADVVITVGAAPIIAADDSNPGFDGLNGGTNVVNVLTNDTLNGTQPTVGTLGNVTMSIVTPAASINGGPVPVLDPATGFVSLPAGTPSGPYTIVYEICEVLNPANCDQAFEVIDVQPLVVEAVDDTPPPVVGAVGNPSVVNVFNNDTLNLNPLNSADVVTTVVTPASDPAVALDTSTGIVSVAPGVPAGVYTITYSICAVLTPTCGTAVVTVTVTAAPIVAVDDTGSANGLTGGVIPSLNVLTNDTLSGVAIVPADVTITPVTTGPLTVNADGTVTVAPNTPAGPYTVSYTVCEILNPANCDTADVVITVFAPAIAAVDDTGSANGLTGGVVPALNVLTNDTLIGVAIVPADVTITPVTTGPLTVNADGTVTVAPNTPAGPYTVSYTVCEILNPANCDTADVVVTVYAASIVANDDSATGINGLTGAPSAINAFANDTLNGVAIVTANVTATIVTPSTNPNVTMDLATGVVSVAPDTAAGPYTITYRICENLNPTNCDTAIVSVTVVASAIVAADDAGTANGLTGGVVPALNVMANDTLNGVAIIPADVTITPVTTGPLTVNANGTVNVAPNTSAGPYTVSYTVCEILNPANCDTADVVVTVVAASIAANDNSVTDVNGLTGAPTALTAFANDTLNGVAVVPANITATIVTPSTNPNVTMNLLTGVVSVAPDTAAGVYTITYRICEKLNPANCDTAIASVTVVAPAVVAVNDIGTANGLTGGVVPLLSVLANDLLNGVAINPADVTITPVTTGPLTLNADGTVTVAPNTPEGVYTVSYTVCEILNPTNCDTADVVITVEVPSNRVSGVIYEDSNSNGVLNGGEAVAGGYTVQLVQNGVVIATTTSAPDGSYGFDDIISGTGYSIAAVNPATGNVVSGRGTFDVTASSIIVDVNLPIDPSGVVYDTLTRAPIAGATLELTNASGAALPAACFASPDQQPQTTGADGEYRFDVFAGMNAACPVGQSEYRLRIVAPAGYLAAPSTSILPQTGALDATICPVDSTSGGSCAVQPQNTAPSGGVATTYFLAFLLQAGDPNVVHNHIPLDPIVVIPGDVSVTKTARSQIGLRGGVMTYTITATNNGGSVTSTLNLVDQMPAGFTLVENSATLGGAPVAAVVSGRSIRLPDVTIPASGRVIAVLQLRIPVNASPGEYVNNAFAIDAVTGDRVGTGGSATIRIMTEAVFDCGDVIGKVFDDRNSNGYQDEGELGIAGVRLATVKGELITTDKNGQYHVPCAMLPDQKIGSNFILKLDSRTLPTGYRITTENPRVIRLTAGKIAKLNFGATIGRVVRLDLRGDAFDASSTRLKPEWESGLDGLIATLAQKNSILRLTYFEGDDPRALSRQRAAAVKKMIEAKWKRQGADYKLLIEVEFVKRQ